MMFYFAVYLSIFTAVNNYVPGDLTGRVHTLAQTAPLPSPSRPCTIFERSVYEHEFVIAFQIGYDHAETVSACANAVHQSQHGLARNHRPCHVGSAALVQHVDICGIF